MICDDEGTDRDGTIRDETRAVAGLEAPCDLNTLSVANCRVCAGLGGSEQTEIVYAIYYGRSVSSRCDGNRGGENALYKFWHIEFWSLPEPH